MAPMDMDVLVLFLLITTINPTSSFTQTGSEQLKRSDDACPPWQFWNSNTGECECSHANINHAVECVNNPYKLALHECYCMTYSKNQTLVGPCMYTCHRDSGGYVFSASVNSTSNLNTAICGAYNRQGQMCGRCVPGYAPPVYSYSLSCVNCTTSNWGKYTAVSLLSLTAFFVFVITFRISATSPKLHGFILFSQIFTCSSNMRSLEINLPYNNRFTPTQRHLVQAFASILGVWNLDFLRLVYSPFCLHPHTNTLQVLALDYLIAVYPLLLIALSYLLVLLYDHNVRLVVCLCRPFVPLFIRFRRQWNIRNSLVDAFATFLLLSYVKILSVSVDLLLPVVLYDEKGQPLLQLYLFNQGDVAYFSTHHHLLYACLALFFLLTFTLLPMLLLFLYPCSCFQVCLNRTGCSYQSLHIFMDSFQGHYKNGTNGTRDFRYFSALYLLLRGLVYASTVWAYQIFSYAYTTVFLMLFTMFVTLAQPYRTYTYFINDNIFLVLTTLMYVTLMPFNFAHPRVTEKAMLPLGMILIGVAILIPLVVPIVIRISKSKCWLKIRRSEEDQCLIGKDV